MVDDDSAVPAVLTVGKVITYLMYAWVIFAIVLLILRVVLLAFSANASAPFVNFVYDTSATFLQPFRGIFPPRTLAGNYFDVAAIFAIIIYGLIGWAFAGIIHFIQSYIDDYRTDGRVYRRDTVVDDEDDVPVRRRTVRRRA